LAILNFLFNQHLNSKIPSLEQNNAELAILETDKNKLLEADK